MNKFFLTSFDYQNLEQIRLCNIERIIKYKFLRHAAIGRVDIPIQYNNKLYYDVVLISRFKGDDIKKMKVFPFFVYTCILKRNIFGNEKRIYFDDLINIGTAELYLTLESAKNKDCC